MSNLFLFIFYGSLQGHGGDILGGLLSSSIVVDGFGCVEGGIVVDGFGGAKVIVLGWQPQVDWQPQCAIFLCFLGCGNLTSLL
ncbi:hypothetical protein CN316_09985 [Bacillus cereus]|nr:hypothetical protein CN316_09985 [Bacillus cereus]